MYMPGIDLCCVWHRMYIPPDSDIYVLVEPGYSRAAHYSRATRSVRYPISSLVLTTCTSLVAIGPMTPLSSWRWSSCEI